MKIIWINFSHTEIWNLPSVPHFLSTHYLRIGPIYWHVNYGSQSSKLFQFGSSWFSCQQLSFPGSWVEILTASHHSFCKIIPWGSILWPEKRDPQFKIFLESTIILSTSAPFEKQESQTTVKHSSHFRVSGSQILPYIPMLRHLSIAKYDIRILETFHKIFIFFKHNLYHISNACLL